jgi:uncharacterized membrane protein
LRKTASSSGHSKIKIFLILVALSAYPVFIHLSFAFDRPMLVSWMWLIAAALGLAVGLFRGSVFPSLLFGGLLAAGIALWWWGDAMALMYVPPVLINLAMMVLFWRTLTLDPAVALYTRRVTIAWTVFFGLVAVESIALALFAPLHIWSLFTNCLNYVFVLLFFVIEYRLRLFCLPEHEHLSFRAFCRLLTSTDLRTLAR